MRLKSFKGFQIGKLKEKFNGNTAEAGDAPVTQLDDMEEQINHKTKDLEATEQQLRELTNTANDSEKDGNTPPQPHGPLSELSVEPENELVDEEADSDTLLGEADEEVKVVEVGAGVAAPAEAEKEPTTKEEESDSLNALFNQEEEEENPLASLINSLPDVTSQELLDDLQEIKEIIRERKHH